MTEVSQWRVLILHMINKDKVTQFAKFQLSILERLSSGEDSREIAERVREKVFMYHNPLTGLPHGSELGISVNDICNLTCKHCYYASTHDKSLQGKVSGLSVDDWRNLTSEAIEKGIRHISIVGKEPLLSPHETRAILETADKKRLDYPEVRYELITNGTLIKKEIDWLKDFNFYFFSVSVDGNREMHDYVRGNGNYDRTLEGIKIARESGIKNITTIFTAMPHNISSLSDMVRDISDAGVEYLSIGFCFPTQLNVPTTHSNSSAVKQVLDNLYNAPKNLDITISLLGDDHANIIGNLYKGGFFDHREIAVTEDLAPCLIFPVSDNPRTAIQLNIIPTMFYSGFRVDYNGTAMDFCVDLRTSEKREGFGNVKRESLTELIEKSKLIWSAYTEKYYLRLQKALQGEQVPIVQSWY